MAGKQQLAASRQEREEAIVKELSTLLTQSLSAADLLFGNSEWQKAWLQNPETFRKTLTDFARQWHENTEKLHQLERQESAQKPNANLSPPSFLLSKSKPKNPDSSTKRTVPLFPLCRQNERNF